MSEIIVDVDHVSIQFRMDKNHTTNLKEWFVNVLKGKHDVKMFSALSDVSFQVHRGEVLGLIGSNGAGKSTILKVISGIYKPTAGEARVKGRISPMLELGSGFDFELSGRENILLNGAILGYSKEFLLPKVEEIIEYSELREFIDMPIKTYSSGMLARLAFSVATIVNPDVLIVDEILSVGDENFQRKSRDRMMELMTGGTTVLFVSHKIEQIREMCDHVVWLDHGRVKAYGPADEICEQYAATFRK